MTLVMAGSQPGTPQGPAASHPRLPVGEMASPVLALPHRLPELLPGLLSAWCSWR